MMNRENERKRLMKLELDKQAQQKIQKRLMEREADGLWDKQ